MRIFGYHVVRGVEAVGPRGLGSRIHYVDEVQGVKRLPLSHVKGRPERRCRFQTTGFYLVSAEDMDRLRRKRVRSPEETIVDIELPVRVSLKRFRGYKRPAGGTRSMRREKRH